MSEHKPIESEEVTITVPKRIAPVVEQFVNNLLADENGQPTISTGQITPSSDDYQLVPEITMKPGSFTSPWWIEGKTTK